MENLIQTATKFAPHLLILVFLTITFLQSGLDKLTDWKGNLSFLKEHFSKTFLKNNVPILLGIIMIGELIVSVLCIVGIVQIYWAGVTTIGFYASALGGKVLLALLLGQRIAKDYAGAMTITVYFIVALFGVYIMS
ncbi:MAG: DoxX family protein [Flavobacteriaceae bacterium]|nr:DoxX family protein [Flavobacteriaceae bacterium]